MSAGPYYSIVVTSRNDSHSGNIGKRMRMFVQGLIHQSRKYQLPIELIIVEWNPPADKPLLHAVLPKPNPEDLLRLRYIIVPAAVHQTLNRSSETGLFQMIAKNVGIRRARGQFVLVANIDLLFSDPLMALLAQRNLDPQCFYRANRNDIPDEIDESMTFEAQMQYAAQHILRRNGWDTRYKWVNANAHQLPAHGRFSRWLIDRNGRKHRMAQAAPQRQYYLLDTVASGDFTLMHRDAWLDIQGYPELTLFALHIDSLGIVAAAALGYQQVTFPREACTYHIDHATGWSALDALGRLRFLEKTPGMDIGTLEEVAYYLLEKRCRLDFNGPDWGFAQEEFEEIVF